MFRMICMSDQFKMKASKDQYKKWNSDFMSCLKGLDLKLVEHQFLCGDKLTLADIIVFNEISLFIELNELDIDSADLAQYPNLVKWFKTKMLANEKFKESNDAMIKALSLTQKTHPK